MDNRHETQPEPDRTAELLASWLERYHRLIQHVVALYCYDPSSREDLYQEIALALWRSIPKFQGRSSESTWIYRVAINTAISAARNRSDLRDSDVSPEQLAGNDADAPVDRSSELEWVYEKIRTLSLIDRSLVALYLDGNSYRDIAEILGLSESNVGAKINRLKGRLKELVEAKAD